MRESNWSDLISKIEDYDKIYIYGFGITGKWLQSQLKKTGKVISFIESDNKKVGFEFNGTKVNSYDELLAKSDKNNKEKSLLINTVVDIHDVWLKAEKLCFTSQVPLGIYLNNHELKDIGEETKDFVDYTMKAVKESHISYFIDKGVFMRSIDILVTERCSMKCQDCSNLMQYYIKPQNIENEKIINELDEILSKIDHLFEIRLIGGEPFVNPNIYEMISYATNLSKVSYVVIYTNATIKLNKDKLLSNNINFNKLSFSITDYGEKLSRQLNQVTEVLDDLKIPFRAHLPEWWTDSGRIINIERTDEEVKELFQNCCGKNLFTLTDNKLYRCPFAANADRLKGIPHDKRNYIEINEPIEKIVDYIGDIDYIPACRYCKGRSWDTPQIEPAIQTRKPLVYETF